MKELVVISGKGGTGKTSLVASFAALARDAVLADCDVDAADLHLLMAPRIEERHAFTCGRLAVVRSADCTGCGECAEACRFGAVRVDGGAARVDPTGCEGCGVCVRTCPAGAIDFPERDCGDWFVSATRFGPMVHAALAIAAENSGKLVTIVRRRAAEIAEGQGRDLVIVDGPPGVGCPVIASLTGASAALVVTEPTLSGEHDLRRVLELTRHFGVPAAVCVNKWDLNPAMADRTEKAAADAGAAPAGRIPYDGAFTAALLKGRALVEGQSAGAAGAVRRVWDFVTTETLRRQE